MSDTARSEEGECDERRKPGKQKHESQDNVDPCHRASNPEAEHVEKEYGPARLP